jgi:hypothetical protein
MLANTCVQLEITVNRVENQLLRVYTRSLHSRDAEASKLASPTATASVRMLSSSMFIGVKLQ